MTTRLLPVDEWPKLAGHPALGGYPLPPVGSAQFVVAEAGDEIVGVWAIVNVLHLEPVWVDETFRGGFVVGRMFAEVEMAVRHMGVKVAWVFADRTEIADYLSRLGLQRVPFEVFQYGGSPCRTS